jgi:outer membrane lipoprotein-sorting protein
MSSILYSAPDAKKLVKDVQKKYQKVKSLQVDFKQINTFKLSGITNEFFGTLLITNDDKFRLETEDQTMVSDGNTFWRFNKLENQVLIDYAKKTEQDIFLKDFLFNLEDMYYSQILSENKINNHKVYELKLVPKEIDTSFFTQIKVWIRDKSWEIDKIIYVDYNDNESEYNIEKLKLNPEITEKQFLLEVPEGLDVVDLRL